MLGLFEVLDNTTDEATLKEMVQHALGDMDAGRIYAVRDLPHFKELTEPGV